MRALCLLLAVTLIAPSAFAFDDEHPAGRFDHRIKYRDGGVIGIGSSRLSSLPDEDPLKQEWSRMASAAGGGWRVWLDERSGMPALATVRGLAWYPGAGNGRASGGQPGIDDLATRSSDYLTRNAAVLGSWGDELVFDPDGSGRRGKDVWQIRFSQVVEGIPVEGARFDFHVAHGNLVTFGAHYLAPVRISTLPTLKSDEARGKLDSYLRTTDDDVLIDLDEPELLLVPVSVESSVAKKWTGARGNGIAHRLVWRFRFTDDQGIATWTGEIDAHDGDVVAFYDDTRYDRAKASVNPISDDGQCHIGGCPEPNYPLPHVDYTVNGGPVQYTDEYGRYECATPGATIETTLDGQYFLISDQCGPISETTTCGEPLDLGVSGEVNCGVAPGASPGNTDAARSAYYSLELVHRKAKFWAPTVPWLDDKVECRTNVNATCNANWGNNTINMYNAGGGCGNTSQIQGVVTHEWGHGFDENDGGDFDEPTEAYADVVAIFESRDSCVGRGFRPNQVCSGFGDTCLSCTGVREMDWDARQNRTPATPSGFIAENCSSGSGACGRHGHCESHVPSETMYDLATRDLPAMGLDIDTAWQLAERIWYQSRPGSGGPIYDCTLPDSDSCTTASWYHQLRVQDDDDGDLTNGTPHAGAIFAAFDRHDIACGGPDDPENQNTSSCPTLETPLAGFTAGTNSVEVYWDPVPGADGYRIYRNENGCDRGQFPVVEVGAGTTSFTDDGLTNTLPVFYRVQAIGSNAACESPVSECLQASAQPLAGNLRLDRAAYGCSHEISLEVNDANHPTSSMTVEIRSDIEPTPESVTLSESSPGSGRYVGTIQTTSDPATSDGLLSTTTGDTITARYVDLDDGAGGLDVVKQAGAQGDCVQPHILQVHESAVSDRSATIAWLTDKMTDSSVLFGETVPPTGEVTGWFQVTDHGIDLNGLDECTRYYYSVGGTDAAGNPVTDDNGGAFYSFETFIDVGQGPQPCHQARVVIDAASVGCDSAVTVEVADGDLDSDPATVETTLAAVTSSTELVAEAVLLTETGPDTARFTAAVPTQSGLPVNGDGILQVTHGDTLTATHDDDDDGTGRAVTAFDTRPVDCAGSDYVSVFVDQITDTTARINWTTDEPTTGHVDWGLTPDLGTLVSSTTLKTAHNVIIENLAECAEAYFRIVATNDRGYSSVADSGGVPYRINTNTIGGVILRDDFETAGAWTLPGEWEIGQPGGLGTAPGDPVSAFNGDTVLGHDLTGLGTYPGDFEPSTVQSAISPSIDASGLTQVELQFDRWLNVSNGSIAHIDGKTSTGSWQNLWSSPFSGGMTESEWTHETHDVSVIAAGNPDFQIRFRQNSHLATSHHAGWNIDRFVLRDASLADFEGCGSCGGAPTFGGVLSAGDDDPCADSGITLTWQGAPAWGTGDSGTYTVYRDTSPSFVPSSTNRVATGVTGTTWTDPAPPADIALYYLVRAENDETCAGGPGNGGMVDDNAVYIATANETAQNAPGDVGGTLLVDNAGGVHARLTWAPAPEAARYHVYRSSMAGDGFARIARPADPLHEDVGALTTHPDWYYLVVGADACGNESDD